MRRYAVPIAILIVVAIAGVTPSIATAAVGFDMDLTPAVEQAAASRLPLVIYYFKGSLDGASFAKSFSRLSGMAVILVVGTDLHGNAPTAEQLGVHSFPTLILWQVKGGKKLSGREVARFSNCQLKECVQQVYLYIATGEAH